MNIISQKSIIRLIVFPKIIFSQEPKNYFLDVLSHGPVVFLYTILGYSYNINITFDSVVYPILFGYFYLFFIWLPWYKLTGDTVYEAMDKNWNNRFMTIFKMNLISFIGHLFAMFIFN